MATEDLTDSKQREPYTEDAAAAPENKSTEPIPDDETERAPVERRPQTFVTYDEPALENLVERHDTANLLEQFGGVEGLAATFRTDLERGIESSTLAAREEQWGVNVLQKKDPVTFFEFVVDALGDRVIQILIAAAIVSIIFGMTLKNPHTNEYEREVGWIEGTAIVISAIIVVLVGSINNYQKAKKFEEMERDQAIKSVEVIRDGEERKTTTDKLQVGDLLKIEVGMEMTCDCVVIKPQGLKMNESALTGEPDLVEKDPRTCAFVISGTFVEEGNAIVMVIAVGMSSFQGRLKGALDAESADTPLQEHLEHLADQIGIFGLVAAIVLVVGLSLKEIINNTTKDGRHWSATAFLNFVLVAVALVAVAIPEGLPLAVTIALAFSMKAMMKDHCMVRVLASCETMGAATAVCSDKTGTLTKNEMTVVQGLLAEEEFTLESYGLTQRDVTATKMMRPEAVNESLALSPALRDLFAEAISVNSTAGEVTTEGKTMWTGNKTEMGMLKFLALIGRDYKTVRAANTDCFSYPFSSAKKRMTTLLRKSSDPSAPCVVHAKGASETILADCSKMYNREGNIVPLTDAARQQFEAVIVDMAKQGNRTIGIATGALEVGTTFPKEDPTNSVDLVWLGVVGIQDPMREEVPAAVASCVTAGITVRMVTGDNIHTAIAIAKKCGIYHDDGFDTALTGPEFRAMAETDKDKLMALLPRLRVLARSSPNDKHILVGLLQEQGEVVAVTGDGTNDAPALKLADVGFAMNSGTDIAKGASAMVLLDDNFASVVNAVRWGRAVNDNIKKFLQFQLTINVGGVLLTLVGSLVSDTSKEPFTPVQLLWLNMIMDTLAALSLATELPEDHCLTRRPVYKQAPLITNRMRLFIIFHAATQFIIIMLLLNLGHKWFETIDDPDECENPSSAAVAADCAKKCLEVGGHLVDGKLCQQGRIHSTIVFNVYIWLQVANVVNSRKIYGEQNPLEGAWSRSKPLIIIFLIIGALQALAVEFTGRFMSVTGLSARNWGISLGFGAIPLVTGFIQRFAQILVKDYIPEEVLEREEKIAEMRRILAEDPHAEVGPVPPLNRERANSMRERANSQREMAVRPHE